MRYSLILCMAGAMLFGSPWARWVAAVFCMFSTSAPRSIASRLLSSETRQLNALSVASTMRSSGIGSVVTMISFVNVGKRTMAGFVTAEQCALRSQP